MSATGASPLVSVGLPVRNGDRFLSEAVEALLGQTLTDLELVISDNASTDATEEICRRFAQQDPRVRYLRQQRDIGAAANFNAVLAAAGGRYFKWAAHDDRHEPTFLERCVGVLEEQPDAVLAYTRAHSIDAEGLIMRPDWGDRPQLAARVAAIRLRAALAPPRDPIPLPVMGVSRRAVLAATGGMLPLPDFDRALLAELSLHGPFVEVGEPLLLQREHAGRMGPRLSADARGAARRLGGSRRFPHWALMTRHLASIRRRPPTEAAGPLYREVARWAWRQRSALVMDLVASVEGVPGVRSIFPALAARGSTWRWSRRRTAAIRALDRCLPTGARPVMVDDDALALVGVDAGPLMSLWGDTATFGFPPDSVTALQLLADRRSGGATHLVVAWPAFWVFDYHREFAEHMDRRCRVVYDDGSVRVYELPAS